MKAERLTRKTYFKKLNAFPGGEAAFYDFTQDENNPGGDHSDHEKCRALADYNIRAEHDLEAIISLPQYFSDEQDILHWCMAVFTQSPLTINLWESAAEHGWSLGFANLGSDGFYLDVCNKQIWLDHFLLKPAAIGRSAYFRNTILTTFVRALRDVWHEDRCGAFEQDYCPDSALLLERVRAADCDTVTILAGWELRSAGFADIWRHLLGSEEGDMAMIFARYLERDPTAFFDGTALVYAFRQWYGDESRVDGCDHETLESLDLFLQDAETHNPFGRKKIDGRIIEKISILPDGVCYLKDYGDTVAQDPLFAGLGDPINQSHLFHLMYDLEVVMVNNVPFRDRKLAGKIFPQGEIANIRF